MEIIFYILIGIIIYTYLGYGAILFTYNKLFSKANSSNIEDYQPEVTVVVAAYNEKDYIAKKIKNTLNQNYPSDKLKVLVIADGSTDSKPLIASRFNNVEVMHRPERMGKTAALNRAMSEVKTPLVFFTDANAMLNEDAIKNMVYRFADKKVGCVAGEKRVLTIEEYGAVGGGEGLYWKYESILKTQDDKFYSAVGAAGELFGVRTHLYNHQPKDTILDDFMISMEIAEKGYTIAYEPNAYALEAPSANMKEELKRKVRISSGGLQSIMRLLPLLNILKYGKLSFSYLSHRVFRWTLAPIALLMLFPINLILVSSGDSLFIITFILQVLFYSSAAVGYYFAMKNKKVKLLYVSFYFTFMNYSVFPAILRLIKGSATSVWERSERAKVVTA